MCMSSTYDCIAAETHEAKTILHCFDSTCAVKWLLDTMT